MAVPSGWHGAALKSTDLPLFANFPWSSLQPQGFLLPKGGATIHVVAEADLPEHHRDYSLDEWAEFDERVAVADTVASRTLEMPQSTGVGRALMVSFDDATSGDSSEQQQHHVTVYWEFLGKRFASHLLYVVGDPNSKQHETRLMNLMRSIKPLSASNEGKQQ